MNRKLWIGVAFGAAMAVAGSASAQDAAKGQEIYTAQKCALCHSIAGKGNAKGSLDGVASKFTADELREWIVNAKAMTAKHKATRKPPMKDYTALPKADVDALVAYMLTLKK